MSTLSIHYDSGNHIIIVKRTGILDAQNSMAGLDKIIEAMRQNGVNKVLVDHRDTEMKADTTSIFEVGYNLANSEGALLVHKIALICAYEKDDPKVEHYRFFEAMLLNRGFNIQIFWGDSQPAYDWLLDNN